MGSRSDAQTEQTSSIRKITYYQDEDSWDVVAKDNYDRRGELYRTVWCISFQAYDADAMFPGCFQGYDFIAGGCTISPIPMRTESVIFRDQYPPKTWNPEDLATGIY
jgi:hypothetical protein